MVREAARRVLDDAERARRAGMDRRTFLRSTAGTAAVVAALAACSEESGGGTAGTFSVPPESTTDTAAAAEALGPDEAAGEVVVDVQTHFLDPDTAGFGRGFPQAGCGDDPARCFTIDRWADLVLGSSDTAVAVLSALPIVADDHPMSIEKMEEARRVGEALCGDARVLLQGEAFPQVGPIGDTLDRMSALADAHHLVAWKTYTHVAGGYSLVDERGEAFLAHVEAIGPRVVCVHKGFGADPADIGPAAAAHPDLTFCVYHSGYEPASGTEAGGVERLVDSLVAAGLGAGAAGAAGGNVYAEIGSTWWSVLGAPDRAAHVLGTLLAHFGPERILWGTDSVWYGSPQQQIEAFRAFEITPEAQERFGYPALTPEAKRRILGHNAAELHGLDLAGLAGLAGTGACASGEREDALGRLDAVGLGDGPLGPVTRRDVLTAWRREHPWFRGRPPAS